MSAKIPVCVLGATGTVGQKFVRLLADHPWFEIAAVAASSASAGRRYGEVVRWREQAQLPPSDRRSHRPARRAPPLPGRDRLLARSTPRSAAPIEQAFARAGAFVVTNTRIHRMDPDVPLLIPEANADHLALIDRQREHGAGAARSWPTPTAPRPRWRWRSRRCTRRSASRGSSSRTMQAVSGAGYPGVASLDILGNVIPHIGGEEEKIERESRKILGTLGRRRRDAGGRSRSARTPTGWRWWTGTWSGVGRLPPPGQRPTRRSRPCGSSEASPCVAGLPSSPKPPIEVGPARRPAAAAARSRAGPRHGGDRRPGPSLPDSRPPAGGAGAQHDPRRRGPGGADRRAAGGGRPARTRRMIVCKFGGTSVADAAAIAPPAPIVPAAPRAAAGRGLGARGGHRRAAGTRRRGARRRRRRTRRGASRR